MILRELVLHNFGPYRGRHVIALDPPSPERPVILIGALNGSGKTTILDALQLALYGPRAQLSNRNGFPYDEYLRRTIHRAVPATDGASIEVEYSTQLDGGPVTLRVRRSWSVRGQGVRERLDVQRDGEFDRLLTNTWSDYIQEFFPLEISELFFFDGEKVAALADPQRSSALMQTAVHSLLGVNLIDQLDTDLTILQRRRRSTLRSKKENTELEVLRDEAGSAEAAHGEAVARRAEAQTGLERLSVRLERVNTAYRKKGGEAYEQRAAAELEYENAIALRDEAHDALRDLAAQDSPLLLIRDQVAALNARVESDHAAEMAAAMRSELDVRDRSIVSFAMERHEATGRALDDYLAEERSARQASDAQRPLVELDAETSGRLRFLAAGGLNEAGGRLRAGLEQAESAESEVVDAERALAAIPDKASIEAILEERRDLLSDVQRATVELNVATELSDRTAFDLERRRAAYARGLDRQVEGEFADAAATRSIDHAGRVRGLLGDFRSAVVAEHIERIEAAVLEAFQLLVRKDTLARGLRLDQDSMDLELTDDHGRAIPTDQLSAGERQLMAVAMLWGLARVSGKRLPTVVDTPLGRLDGIHRDRISNRYFPVASHQVIVLSTDEEIDADLYRQLSPYIGRSYTLEYDDATHGTSVVEGYHLLPESADAN